MRITRSTLRRLIAEESARLLREAAEDEITTTNEAERGKKGKGRDNNCLYITYGGRGVYYFVAKGGLDEREAVERGRDVTAELVGDEDVADPLSLYDWLQNHDQIEYVFDDESIGGFAEKHEFMEQLRGVGEEEGLFADDEFVNEEDELEGVYGEEPPEYDEEFMGDDDSWMDAETGEDDIPYGAADVALRIGRGHRTDEGHDPLDSSDYEGSRHRRAYSDDPDDESGKVDRWGEPIPYLKHDSEATDLDADAEDEMAGEEEDWSWDGHDYEPDLKRTSHYAHTAQKYKETGNSDPGMDPDDHSFGRARGLDESDYGDKTDPYERGEGTYGKRPRREEIGLTRSSMIWDPTGAIGLVKNEAQADDINYNADLELPDPDRTRPIHQTILGKPGFRPVAELYIDLEYGQTNMDTKVKATIETDDGQTHVGTGRTAVAAIKKAEAQWRAAGSDDAAYARDVEETDAAHARDRDRPGNFIKEGDDDSQSEEDEDYGDTDWAAAEVRAGRHAEGPYGGLDSDTPVWHRQQKRQAAFPPRAFSDDKSGRGMYFRDDGDDISMGYTDEEGDSDNLSESRWAKLAGILKG